MSTKPDSAHRTCRQCGREYEYDRSNPDGRGPSFCSDRCSGKHRREYLPRWRAANADKVAEYSRSREAARKADRDDARKYRELIVAGVIAEDAHAQLGLGGGGRGDQA